MIIPNFNNGATLGRAIRSVQAQVYPAHEIIVIDDGSTDDTAEVARALGDQVIYIHQQNAGVAVARNTGVQRASGDWLAFLDADDEFTPDRLQAHAEWIQDEPDLDFLLADQEARDTSGNLLCTFVGNCKAGRELLNRYPGVQRIPIADNDFESLIGDGFMEIRTISMPRRTFLEIGGFPVGHKVGEDLHLFVRLMACSRKGGVVPRSLAIYHIYPTSVLRKDPVQAAENFVASVDVLEAELHDAPAAVRRGYLAKRHAVHLMLAYAYLRAGRKTAAMCAITRAFLRLPTTSTFRDVLSILRGYPKSHPHVAPV